MERDKQMINDLIEIFDEEYGKRYLITPQNTADKLISKGYRKASEVAREIFEEIEKMLINEHIESFKALDDTWTHRFKESLFIELNKLKKKYTEGK